MINFFVKARSATVTLLHTFTSEPSVSEVNSLPLALKDKTRVPPERPDSSGSNYPPHPGKVQTPHPMVEDDGHMPFE